MLTKIQGFSLIELLISVAIVGILAGVALPSFQSSVEKGRRADAKVALAQAVAQQERQFTLVNQYSDDIDDLGGAATDEGFYTLSVAYTTNGNACGADKDCYTLTATAIGVQASDTSCGNFSINSLGQKTASGSLGNTACW